MHDAQSYLANIPEKFIDLDVIPATRTPSDHYKHLIIQSGYTMANGDSLAAIDGNRLNEEFKKRIRVAVHEDIPVTSAGGWGKNLVDNSDVKVTHVLCAAAAVGYNRGRDSQWRPLASAILQSSYSVFSSEIEKK